jgi:hypothetical protein
VSDLDFQIKVSVDKETGTVVAAYFQMREGKATRVLELADGKAFANYGSTGKLLGIELLAPCEITVLDQLFKKEPKVIKDFLMRTAPPEMLKAA